MFDLWTPFRGDVLERGGGHHGEADEEDVCLWVGEGAEAVVVLLPRGVPQSQGHRHSVADHWGGVVVEPKHNTSNQASTQRGRFSKNKQLMFTPARFL